MKNPIGNNMIYYPYKRVINMIHHINKITTNHTRTLVDVQFSVHTQFDEDCQWAKICRCYTMVQRNQHFFEVFSARFYQKDFNDLKCTFQGLKKLQAFLGHLSFVNISYICFIVLYFLLSISILYIAHNISIDSSLRFSPNKD